MHAIHGQQTAARSMVLREGGGRVQEVQAAFTNERARCCSVHPGSASKPDSSLIKTDHDTDRGSPTFTGPSLPDFMTFMLVHPVHA